MHILQSLGTIHNSLHQKHLLEEMEPAQRHKRDYKQPSLISIRLIDANSLSTQATVLWEKSGKAYTHNRGMPAFSTTVLKELNQKITV